MPLIMQKNRLSGSEEKKISSPTKTSAPTRSGLIMTPGLDQAIDKILTGLLEKIPAQYILLTDNSGQLITVQGKREQADPVALGALVASDLAASQEMARLMGEYHHYQMILREGPQVNTWIIDAGAYLVLMFKVSSCVPLGWTRLVIRHAAEEIAQLAAKPVDYPSYPSDGEFNSCDLTDQMNKSLDDLWRL